jgi:type III restriction enzyme
VEYNCDASVNGPAKPDRSTDSGSRHSPHLFGFAIDYTDGAMNLRSYYPDFVAVDNNGTRWLLETKGAETGDVAHKDIAAAQWCANATLFTGQKWEYLKVHQKGFETLQPSRLEHLAALKSSDLFYK